MENATNSAPVRVRFAPSPTGYLHVGGARTALFNHLFARHHGGTFILRIEDTDRDRSTDEYIEAILDGMRWLGMDWDEGPFRQTDRYDIYKGYIQKLLDEGMAYVCFCTPAELEERRKAAMAEGRTPKYDGRCRDLKTPPPGFIPGQPAAVRFKMPAEGETVVEDLIRGRVVFNNSELDDLIIARSDGTPTYNVCVVIDDVDMNITHVIRGDDHLNNTPRQAQIYKALGRPVPLFAHLPMILGADKARLSKRHGATSVQSYREMGYLPQALLNYLVRLGWSHGDQEVFTREELIEKFSLEHVGKAAAVFNPEKLLWINAEYIKHSAPEKLIPLVMRFLADEDTGILQPGPMPLGGSVGDAAWFARAIATLQERSRTLLELANSLKYYLREDVALDEKAAKKFINADTKPFLEAVIGRLDALPPDQWSVAAVEAVFNSLMAELGVQLGKLAQPVRVAMTGNTVSPGIYEVLEIVGRERSIKRLQRAIASIGQDGI
jgi:glutamyl-tRNA synthetase